MKWLIRSLDYGSNGQQICVEKDKRHEPSEVLAQGLVQRCRVGNMSCSRNPPKRGLLKGDTGTLDYGPYGKGLQGQHSSRMGVVVCLGFRV